MGKKCWEILNQKSPLSRNCKKCPAYIENKNCWEAGETPCSTSPAICVLIDCPVYQENKERIEKAIHASLQERNFSQIYYQMKAVSEKRCWEFKNCSPETYLNCPAFVDSKNCWEVKKCNHKSEDKNTCAHCPIFIFHTKFK